MKNEVPIWQKYLLSAEEAAAYFHIGVNKLRQIMSENQDSDWVFRNGSHFYIKRKKFEQLLDRSVSL